MNPSLTRTTEPSVTFWGAAQSVTGSMHLVEAAGRRVLLDCGLARGRSEETRQRNRRFPFDPTSLDAVVLSHAHVDHCGNLPNLVRQGFTGPIYCTPPTRDLVAVMLADSARIQEEDAAVACIAGSARSQPLYTRGDAHRAIRHCVTLPYGQDHLIADGVQVRLVDAGHLLGSAMVVLTVSHRGRDRRIVFTGDVGRRGLPFLPEPSIIPTGDLVICESTYGGRFHDSAEDMAEKMADVVRRTAERGGKVLVPAFSLGRTQVVAHYVRKWMAQRRLPRLPLYVDSPLAISIAEVYEQHAGALHPDEPEVDAVPVHYFLSHKEARRRTTTREPCLIVASGGMCEGGRVVDHLHHHIDDPRSSLVLVSYQAPGSLGARLRERKPTVRLRGKDRPKWIDVVELKGFSGHADHDDLLALLRPGLGATGKVRLVHGEPESAESLADGLRTLGFADVGVPRRKEIARVA
jgi:metallo-beta-lactamase family protein